MRIKKTRRRDDFFAEDMAKCALRSLHSVAVISAKGLHLSVTLLTRNYASEKRTGSAEKSRRRQEKTLAGYSFRKGRFTRIAGARSAVS